MENIKKNEMKFKKKEKNRLKKERKKQKEEDRKQKFLERKEALQQYKAKKNERYKVLSKKTSKGQPLMSGRIEMLLEKIKATSE